MGISTSRYKKRSSTKAHKCVQTEKLHDMDVRIKELHNIVTGNGTPENGMIFQLALLNKGQGDLLEKLNGIGGSISELTGKYNESIKLANTAKNAIAEYKKEVGGIEKGKETAHKEEDRIKTHKRENLRTGVTLTMAIIAAIGLGLTAYFGFRNSQKADTTIRKVDDLGTPVVTNSRGQTVPLPDGYTLKMFPNDFNNDTIPEK